jgi:hypothetical protein
MLNEMTISLIPTAFVVTTVPWEEIVVVNGTGEAILRQEGPGTGGLVCIIIILSKVMILTFNW